MDRKAYQEAIKKFIWVEGEQAMDYISLQLVSEFGELLGGIAKRLVGRDISDEYLALEAGDICFFIAWTCNIQEVDFSLLLIRDQALDSWTATADEIVTEISELLYYTTHGYPGRWKSEVMKYAAMLMGWAVCLSPMPLEEILQMNIDKLEVRHARRLGSPSS